jgi:hypothetical protein
MLRIHALYRSALVARNESFTDRTAEFVLERIPMGAHILSVVPELSVSGIKASSNPIPATSCLINCVLGVKAVHLVAVLLVILK